MLAARRSWKPIVVEPELRAGALAVARDVMSRLRDPQTVEAVATTATGRFAGRWVPHGVAHGHAGHAVACGYFDRCFPEERWDRTAHDYLTRAATGAQARGIETLGLLSGLCGLSFATVYLSRGGLRYRELIANLDETLYADLAASAGELAGPGMAVGMFDAISGWAGVVGYLLIRGRSPMRDDALRATVARLVDATREVDGVPAWHTPGALMVDTSMAARHPEGVLNCGLAHGISGPVAALSLAKRAGLDVPGLDESVRRSADWLASRRVDDSWGASFPSVVSLDPAAPPPAPTRNAWCYGSPGVASALRLAGDALPAPELRALSVEAIEAAMRRPPDARRIDSPGFCHGIAGLLQIALRFGQDEDNETIHRGVRDLVSQLLTLYEPDAAFGYRTIEPDGARLDKSGVLEGAAAIAMVLLAAVMPCAPDWDRLFLLA